MNSETILLRMTKLDLLNLLKIEECSEMLGSIIRK